MIISKGIKHKVTQFCTHLYDPEKPVPITPQIKKEINCHFNKTVAQNLKCLFLSLKYMSVDKFNKTRAECLSRQKLKSSMFDDDQFVD